MGADDEGPHARQRAAEPVRHLLGLGHLPLARPSCRPCSTRRPPPTRRSRRSTTTPRTASCSSGATCNLNNYVMVGDPDAVDHRRLLRVRRPRVRHQAGAGRHAQAGHHGQRRAAGRGARAAVRLPARGRHVRLLQLPRRRRHACWRTTPRTSRWRTSRARSATAATPPCSPSAPTTGRTRSTRTTTC